VTSPRRKRRTTPEDVSRIIRRRGAGPLSPKDSKKLLQLGPLSPEEKQRWRESHRLLALDVQERILGIGPPRLRRKVAQSIYDRYYGKGVVRVQEPVDVEKVKKVLRLLKRRWGISR
jgi:hypothetical protein